MHLFKNLFSNPAKKVASFKVFEDMEGALKEVDRIGFAVISLLDEHTHKDLYAESAVFLEEVKKYHPDLNFLSLGRSEHHHLINASKEIIRKYLSEPLTSFFHSDEYDIMYGTHLLKSNSKSSTLNPHQDSSHVDESIFSSYYVWVPITPPSPDFGTLEVIPYSHKLDIPYRSLNIPWALMEHEMSLWKYMKKIMLKAGQAVIFSSKLVHASGLNKTSEVRMAANIMVKPSDAAMLHFYSDDASNHTQIEMHQINPEFYYNENIMERPKGYPLIKTVENSNRHYTLKELEAIFQNE